MNKRISDIYVIPSENKQWEAMDNLLELVESLAKHRSDKEQESIYQMVIEILERSGVKFSK